MQFCNNLKFQVDEERECVPMTRPSIHQAIARSTKHPHFRQTGGCFMNRFTSLTEVLKTVDVTSTEAVPMGWNVALVT